MLKRAFRFFWPPLSGWIVFNAVVLVNTAAFTGFYAAFGINDKVVLTIMVSLLVAPFVEELGRMFRPTTFTLLIITVETTQFLIFILDQELAIAWLLTRLPATAMHVWNGFQMRQSQGWDKVVMSDCTYNHFVVNLLWGMPMTLFLNS